MTEKSVTTLVAATIRAKTMGANLSSRILRVPKLPEENDAMFVAGRMHPAWNSLPLRIALEMRETKLSEAGCLSVKLSTSCAHEGSQ